MRIFDPVDSGRFDARRPFDAGRPAHFIDATTLRVALMLFGLSLFLAGVLIGALIGGLGG